MTTPSLKQRTEAKNHVDPREPYALYRSGSAATRHDGDPPVVRAFSNSDNITVGRNDDGLFLEFKDRLEAEWKVVFGSGKTIAYCNGEPVISGYRIGEQVSDYIEQAKRKAVNDYESKLFG